MKDSLNKYQVPLDKLTLQLDFGQMDFTTTQDITMVEEIIGQARAQRAIELGLAMKRQGYNIFMSGLTGTGKTRYAQSTLKEKAQRETTPQDICYLYNFKKPNQPLFIKLAPGEGVHLKKDMEDFIVELQESLAKVFGSEDYENQKNQYLKDFQNERQRLLQELHRFAEDKNFVLKSSNAGFLSVPVINGQQINAEDYDNLSQGEREEIENRSLEIQEKGLEVIRLIQIVEKNFKEKIKKLQDSMALFAIGHLIQNLENKYQQYPRVVKHLKDIEEDILNNLDKFFASEEDPSLPLPWNKKEGKEGVLYKYQVNLFVDNSETKGSPVVFEFNPTYNNLIGRIEYENQLGVITTDYLKIKPGALHKANGGYLVLQAKDVLTNIFAWDGLKRALKTKEVHIEDYREQLGGISFSSLKPEPIDINVKVILLGHPFIYHLLYERDEDFPKLFKIKAEFDYEMDLNQGHVQKLASFISRHCQEEGLRHFHRTGVLKVLEYSARLAGNQDKLTTRFNELIEIIYEAEAMAQLDDSQFVTDHHVNQAIKEKRYRSNGYQEKIQEMLNKGKILITTEGSEVGQINGLAVLNLGEYSFGKPNRITASSYMGRNGIINIERESKLSGKIHDKGVLILSGYLGQKYAQNRPLSVSISLCFEQSYGGVDGDSASCAELYAILSSLSEVPLRQSIAVTGSVNQKGDVQPVGGVTEKVEGFFELCKERGLSGAEGVIIPKQNIRDLVLSQEILSAIKEGLFKIYAIARVEEGLEILTGLEPGEKDQDGQYHQGTINYLVEQKLRGYLQNALALRKEDKEDNS